MDDEEETAEEYRAELIIFADWFIEQYDLNSLDAEQVVDAFLADDTDYSTDPPAVGDAWNPGGY